MNTRKLKDTFDRWAILINDGRGANAHKHFSFHNCQPEMFSTRAQARARIEERYGYIRSREDLRAAPHWWRVPRAVRVRVRLELV